jgi:hypothetical protein
VIIESPYAATPTRTIESNLFYARKAMRHCLGQQEAPFASHLLYTQVLNDTTPEERQQGITAGFVWGELADLVAVYCDYGISKGMLQGIRAALERGTPVVYRFQPAGEHEFAESLLLPDLYAHEPR